MPWARTDVREERVKFVVRAASGRERMAVLCREFGISRPTGYRWRRRYEEAGSVAGLKERSRRPQSCPWQTEWDREERVVELRQEWGWGAKKIAILLGEEGRPLAVSTINRILKRRGLVGEAERQPAAVERFERSAPNELWQMDGKGEYTASDGTCYPLSILDDHSRYAVGLFGLRVLGAEEVQRCLVRTFERYGVPEALLMDHGSPWWSTTNGYGLTRLSVWLLEQGIRLHYGRVRHPQTQGKVERFHRTLAEAVRHRGRPQWLGEWPGWLEAFQRNYNEQRPHEALGMRRPRERYRPSPRRYDPHPPEWEYPPGSLVRRLNPDGCLYWQGKQWFVCEALPGRWVQLEKLGELLLVSYRHMYVREIDAKQGRTRPLIVSCALGRALRSPSGLPPTPAQPQTRIEKV